ncbi:MAG: hypothetical protein ACFFCP_00710 [Promethearchaeota archaeon]
MANNGVDCTALCKSFKCERHPPALKIRMRGGNKEVWCTWIDEECDQGWCVHSKCAERRMTQDGKCRQVVRRPQQTHVRFDEPYPDAMPKDIARKFRPR